MRAVEAAAIAVATFFLASPPAGITMLARSLARAARGDAGQRILSDTGDGCGLLGAEQPPPVTERGIRDR